MSTGFTPIARRAGGLGARLRRWISRTFRKSPPGKPIPSAEQMQALREKFAKPGKVNAH